MIDRRVEMLPFPEWLGVGVQYKGLELSESWLYME